jgi:hypothetical protein
MKNPSPRKLTLFDILFLPVGCLMEASPLVLVITLGIGILLGSYLYFNVNMDFFGLGRPDFKTLQFDEDYTHASSPDGSNWVILYEKPEGSIFTGVVRSISPIRLSMVPFLTHDILVTSGDYSDPDLVSTSVHNHHYTWYSSRSSPPVGTINLIHAVPLNEDIYHQLLQLRTWQQVTLRGREILRIEAFNPSAEYLGEWHDTGCNSMLVTSVEFN